MHTLQVPSLFFTMTTGEQYGELEGSIIFISNILSTSLLNSFNKLFGIGYDF